MTDDPMSKGKIHEARLTSYNTFELRSPYEGAQSAMLSIRDHPRFGKDVILKIQRGQLICNISSCVVPVRFDEGSPQNFSTAESADYDSTVLFIRNYKRFVKSMAKAKTVRIEPTFYQDGNISLTFDIDGFSQARFASDK